MTDHRRLEGSKALFSGMANKWTLVELFEAVGLTSTSGKHDGMS